MSSPHRMRWATAISSALSGGGVASNSGQHDKGWVRAQSQLCSYPLFHSQSRCSGPLIASIWGCRSVPEPP